MNTVPQSAEDITISWVQRLLETRIPGFDLINVTVQGSVGHGEGYMSDLYALTATGIKNGQRLSHELVVKVTNFQLVPNLSNEIVIFRDGLEVNFYNTLRPKLQSVVSKQRLGLQSSLGDRLGLPERSHGVSLSIPKIFFAGSDIESRKSVRVMENLKSKGFKTRPFPQPLDLEEMTLTVGCLAQFHGLSLRLEQQFGTSLIDKYDWLQMDRENLAMFARRYQVGVRAFEIAFPDQQALVGRLRQLTYERVVKHMDSVTSRMRVLVHGDCWNGNIMFKYANGRPIKVKLVDWQDVGYLPPTFDLALLFLCSGSWEMFYTHRENILAHYHQEFLKTVRMNEDYERSYPLEQLKTDFRDDCLMGVFGRLYRLSLLPSNNTTYRVACRKSKTGE